jgi:monooxygenase
MTTPDVDVLIIGAGLSGVGAAAHLSREHPGKRYAILEAREALGGTWDLFRYPGIRSDSDLHTFCYDFKPWTDDESIADAPSILRYLEETAAEHDIRRHIRFGHRVREARWSTEEACWTVHAQHGSDAEPVQITARWLFCAGGYYRYDRGHTPEIPGLERFAGRVVHPQFWPEDLAYAGKRVVVIGSGATAVTLVPSLAAEAAHVAMLQRTPTYVLSVPAVDPIHAWLKRRFGPVRAHRVARWKNVRLDRMIYRASRRYPKAVRKLIRSLTVRELPAGYDVDTHFSPPYDPWDQRMCAVLDGDLFRVVREQRASIVTDRISEVTETGVVLESGRRLEADIIITATGLEMVPFAGVSYVVDERPVDVSKTITYKGMMLTGVPNFVYGLGYTNASWTLKIDLICAHFCRLLALLHDREYDYVVPEAPPADAPTAPLVSLASGYVQRAIDTFPKQGATEPWLLKMDYLEDRRFLLEGPVGDHLRFRRVPTARRTPELSLVGSD